MKNVVRKTLHALIPAAGTDQSTGPVPNKIMEMHSATKMPLPHHAITLSMCRRIWLGTSRSAVGYTEQHGEDEVIDHFAVAIRNHANRAVLRAAGIDPIADVFQIVLDPGFQGSPRQPLTCAQPVIPAFTLCRSIYPGIDFRK